MALPEETPGRGGGGGGDGWVRGQDGRVSSAGPPTAQGQDGDTSRRLTLHQAWPQLCWELRPGAPRALYPPAEAHESPFLPPEEPQA